MQVSSSLTSLLPVSPPPRVEATKESSAPVDLSLAAKDNHQDRSWRKTLVAMASLATTLGPQAVGAVPLTPAPATEVVTEHVTPEPSFLEKTENFFDQVKETTEETLSAVVPEQVTKEYKHDWDGWKFQFQGVDADFKPRLRLKGDSGLRLYGKFLETSLSQGEQLNESWSTSHGVRAGLRGEINTYEDPELDLYTQVYKRWDGRLGEDTKASLDIGLGFRNRLVGGENQRGMSTGLSLRQKLDGKEKTLFGRQFQPFVDSSQGIYRNLETNQTTASYSVMAGAKHVIKVKVFGRDGKLTLTVGPEFKGRFSEDDSKPFDVGFKTKLKARF